MTKAADEESTSRPGARRSSRLADTLLVVASMVVSIVVAEGVVRYLNGQPLLVCPLPEVIDTAPVKPALLAQVPLAEGVDRNWFYSDPPPLPNRSKPPPGWKELYRHYQAHPSGHNE